MNPFIITCLRVSVVVVFILYIIYTVKKIYFPINKARKLDFLFNNPGLEIMVVLLIMLGDQASQEFDWYM
jgi:hypothetical protein